MSIRPKGKTTAEWYAINIVAEILSKPNAQIKFMSASTEFAMEVSNKVKEILENPPFNKTVNINDYRR